MKSLRTEAGLETFVEALFSRFPGLLGFSVQDAEGELVLVDEEPGALELLRGRTFARTLH